MGYLGSDNVRGRLHEDAEGRAWVGAGVSETSCSAMIVTGVTVTPYRMPD